MMYLLEQIAKLVLDAAVEAFGEGFRADFSRATIELSRDEKHGDFASNIAMVSSKNLGVKPREIADKIISLLMNSPMIAGAEVAGPGFINIRLKNQALSAVVGDLVIADERYFKLDIGREKRVNIEYASPNPTGPMHIGHARSAILGEVLSNIFHNCGYLVEKEYYINDAGNQIGLLAESLFIRYQELLGQANLEIPQGGYPGEYLIPMAQNLIDDYGNKLLDMSEDERLSLLKSFAVAQIMELIKADLRKIGVHHDIFSSEYQIVHQGQYIEKAIELLTQKNLVYRGMLEPPKGKQMEDWEAQEQLLFRSTEFGDDVDRVLQKSDGSYTYFAADIGYHLHKIERGYDKLILTLGADHAGYVKRLQSCVAALDPEIEFKIILFQLVNLMKDGQPFKMSKRAGNYLFVDDVLAEIDVDVLKFMMLTSKSDTTLDIDFTKAKEQSKDNLLFYIQYAHARACSIIRKGRDVPAIIAETDKDDVDFAAISLHAKERAMIKLLAYYHNALESAAKNYDPLKIINYLNNLATEFHSLWNADDYQFLNEEDVKTSAFRISLCAATAKVIAKSLSLLNVRAIEKM